MNLISYINNETHSKLGIFSFGFLNSRWEEHSRSNFNVCEYWHHFLASSTGIPRLSGEYGNTVYLLVLETKKKHALFLPFLSPLSPSLSWIKVHIRYIKILTWLSRGFRVKIANFSWLHCLPIPRRDLSTKKTRLNIEKCPESPGVMLEFKYIERGIH